MNSWLGFTPQLGSHFALDIDYAIMPQHSPLTKMASMDNLIHPPNVGFK